MPIEKTGFKVGYNAPEFYLPLKIIDLLSISDSLQGFFKA